MGNFAENLNLGKRVLPPPVPGRGDRKSLIQFGNTHLRYRCIQRMVIPYDSYYNKTHLKLLQEDLKVELQRIIGKNNFSHKILGIFNFFYL